MKTMIARTLLKAVAAVALICGAGLQALAEGYKVEEMPNVQVENKDRYLTNPDGIVSPEAQTRIDYTLAEIRKATSAEVSVVIVNKIDGSDANGYANRLFNYWGLGKGDKKNGLLMLVVKDSRKVALRTGSGLEGVLPDVICGRIIREKMVPQFQAGNFEGGIEAGLATIYSVLTDPVAKQEIMSDQPDNAGARKGMSPFMIYIWCAIGLACLMLLCLVFKLASLSGKQPYEKYAALETWKSPTLALSMLGLGIPVITPLIIMLLLHIWRNGKRYCGNCNCEMKKVDEEHDNDYLTPAQDLEEQLKSIDYDVWVCPDCGETEVFPFVNKNVALFECEKCHSRTMRLISDNVAVQPTTTHEGEGAKTFDCLYCHHRVVKKYPIAKLASATVIPFIIPGGGSGHGGGFGGGSIGGGFGGGSTSGGGASGSW